MYDKEPKAPIEMIWHVTENYECMHSKETYDAIWKIIGLCWVE